MAETITANVVKKTFLIISYILRSVDPSGFFRGIHPFPADSPLLNSSRYVDGGIYSRFFLKNPSQYPGQAAGFVWAGNGEAAFTGA